MFWSYSTWLFGQDLSSGTKSHAKNVIGLEASRPSISCNACLYYSSSKWCRNLKYLLLIRQLNFKAELEAKFSARLIPNKCDINTMLTLNHACSVSRRVSCVWTHRIIFFVSLAMLVLKELWKCRGDNRPSCLKVTMMIVMKAICPYLSVYFTLVQMSSHIKGRHQTLIV